MEDPGYENYRDPRLQPPEQPPVETCGDCCYYKELEHRLSRSVVLHIGACVFEIFQADTFDELENSELDRSVSPHDEICKDFKQREDQ